MDKEDTTLTFLVGHFSSRFLPGRKSAVHGYVTWLPQDALFSAVCANGTLRDVKAPTLAIF